MKFVVRPELPTAALRSSQATLAAVDNSAPLATRRSPLKTRGNVVQTTGATSAVAPIEKLNSCNGQRHPLPGSLTPEKSIYCRSWWPVAPAAMHLRRKSGRA